MEADEKRFQLQFLFAEDTTATYKFGTPD